MKRISLLVEAANRFPSLGREQVLARILCGELYAGGERITDPRRLVDPGVALEFRQSRFVSRGGEKLDYALEEWHIDVSGLVFVDAGASTGGFTDCLLKRNASFVHTVDVGRNQLDYTLRMSDRVSVLESTNILSIDRLEPVPDAAVADLSFRSILGAASHIIGLTSRKWLIVLIKPQFELASEARRAHGKFADLATMAEAAEANGFRGVIRDEETLNAVLDGVRSELRREGVDVERSIPSPILGRKGNREYLFLLRPLKTD